MTRRDKSQHEVGDVVRVRLYPSGLIVEAEIKAIVEQTTGRKYQVSFDVRTALIDRDQVVEE
jgi:hypothetical protein